MLDSNQNHNKVDEKVAPPSDGDDSEIEIQNEENFEEDPNCSSLLQQNNRPN